MPPQDQARAQWADYAKPGSYTTTLSPAEEQRFRQWVRENKIPWRDTPTSDYDMRGYWRAQQSGDANARTAIDPVDKKPHYPDRWKTPYHKTFSRESQYALPTAGHWEGETFVPPQQQSGGATTTAPDVDVSEILADPDFQQLSPAEKNKVLLKVDPAFAALPPAEQAKALNVIQYGPPAKEEGFWNRAGSVLATQAKGLGALAIRPAIEAVEGYRKDGLAGAATRGLAALNDPLGMQRGVQDAAIDAVKNYDKRRAEGYNPVYAVVAPVAAAATNVNLPAMEDAAGKGQWKAVAAEAVVPAAEAAGGAAAHEIGLFDHPPNPYKAIDEIFRVVPSENPRYRENLMDAKADFQAMAREQGGKALERGDSAGGWFNPEMYFRKVNNVVDRYLKNMYQTERAPQIQTAERMGAKVTLTENPGVIEETMKWLARSELSDSPVKATAQRLVADPHYQMSIAEADALARDINAQLREFESGSPEAQYRTAATSRVKAGLKRMDAALGTDINARLREVGQPGIEAYERRYAALSAFNKQVETWMNALERERLGLRTHEFVTSHGRGGISAGIKFFKENAGRELASAFNTLRYAPDIPGPNSIANPPTMTPPPRQLPGGGTTQRAGGVSGGAQAPGTRVTPPPGAKPAAAAAAPPAEQAPAAAATPSGAAEIARPQPAPKTRVVRGTIEYFDKKTGKWLPWKPR